MTSATTLSPEKRPRDPIWPNEGLILLAHVSHSVLLQQGSLEHNLGKTLLKGQRRED